MATNVNSHVSAGFETVHWGLLDSSGRFAGDTAVANGTSAGAGVIGGVQTANIDIPEPQILDIEGSNTVVSSFLFPPTSKPQFDITHATFNLAFRAATQGTSVYTIGDWEFGMILPKDQDYVQMWLLMTQLAKSQDSGSLDSIGFSHLLLRCQVFPRGTDGLNTGAQGSADRLAVIVDNTAQYPWGEAFTTGNQGKVQASIVEVGLTENRLSMHRFTGDGTETEVTLDYTPAAATSDKVAVWKNGTKLTYTTDYTVNTSTKVVTLVSAPTAGDAVVILYEWV